MHREITRLVIDSDNRYLLDELDKFVNLQYLDCSNNELESLTINNLYLHTLICSNNKLKKLNLTSLFRLKKLHCDKNQLVAIYLNYFCELEELRCCGNRLKICPLTLQQITKISIFKFDKHLPLTEREQAQLVQVGINDFV